MKKIGSTISGSIIVEMSSSQFDALIRLIDTAPKENTESTPAVKSMSLKERVDFVKPRLDKLKPKKKAGLLKSIETMFQFVGGITSAESDKVISALAKEGYLSVDSSDKVLYNA